ncbi:hypothetical protein PoB_003204600 [Plakobranchus ocellatus]|uniref:CCHC-type domain-containing protein n=1 Tax=Plakobranchus ocellatus TaxID=259542 RepID=A0AAV4AB32_9GAST|nr:hypothetical protein PoB_003204600 [Plakobranchus ocellatus]
MNQRSCFKCKRFGHIARDCVYSSLSAKKADAGMTGTAPRGGVRKDPTIAGPALEVAANLQSKLKDVMLQMARGNAGPVLKNCTAVGDPKRT